MTVSPRPKIYSTPMNRVYFQVILLVSISSVLAVADTQRVCRTGINSSDWPTPKKWEQLNATVEGHLIQTVPAAAVCHESFNGQPTYDMEKCAKVQEDWLTQGFHQSDPTSLIWNLWTNHTCMPTTNPKDPCTLGRYPNYVVDAMSVEHVQASVRFAKENNIRLVIRNTGHDVFGKSSGPESLSIWTHNLRSIKLDNDTGILTIGSGWQTGNLQDYLSERGRIIVSGTCENVGYAGGFIQGGGRGPLIGLHGMGADQALSFDLVTADGNFIKADESQNSDLFWALRGGGGSAWGVVTSVTVQTLPDLPVAFMSLNITDPNKGAFWASYESAHREVQRYAESGLFFRYQLDNKTFFAGPILGPGKTLDELTKILSPLVSRLDNIGVNYTAQSVQYPSYHEMYKAQYAGAVSAGGDDALLGSRVITRKSFAENSTQILRSFRKAIESGFSISGFIMATGSKGKKTDNSVHKAWRNVVLESRFGLPINGTDLDAAIKDMNAITEEVRQLSPGGAGYVNEANAFEPNWKEDFWGDSYPKLLSIKKKWDPTGIFYGKTAVGSEWWEEVDGQLCQVRQ